MVELSLPYLIPPYFLKMAVHCLEGGVGNCIHVPGAVTTDSPATVMWSAYQVRVRVYVCSWGKINWQFIIAAAFGHPDTPGL